MKQISTTYIAQIITLLVFVLPQFGLEVVDKNLLTNNITQFSAFAFALYVFIGRFRAGGISILGIRKK